MPDTSDCRRKRLAATLEKGLLRLVFTILTASFLSSCGSPQPPNPSSVLSVQLKDGVAWLGGYQGLQLVPGQSLDLNWNQTLWAGKDAAATLLIGEDDVLTLDPGSGFRLVSPAPPEKRPVLRLLEGRLQYRATSSHYALGARFELAADLRILVTDLVVVPIRAGTELALVIENDVTTVLVSAGELEAEGNGVSATLFAAWRAIVRPGEPMQVIPPDSSVTPTPTPTRTPTSTPRLLATSTPVPTDTPTPTPTPTATPTFTPSPTPRPSATATATPTPLPTPVPTTPPTQPPPPPPPTEPPPPTQPPPPTDTPPPPPTETTRPPP